MRVQPSHAANRSRTGRGSCLGNAEKAVLLCGTHLARAIAALCNTWAQGAFWQQTLPLSVVSQIAGKVMKGLLWA